MDKHDATQNVRKFALLSMSSSMNKLNNFICMFYRSVQIVIVHIDKYHEITTHGSMINKLRSVPYRGSEVTTR